MNAVITSEERRVREKTALKSEILAAARTLFAEQGYEAVTMRNIASRIGYTATALYYHFPDKRALMIELCNCDFAALATLLKNAAQLDDPIERIRRMGVEYVKFGLEFPHHYRFMFMTPLPNKAGEYAIEKGNPDQDAYAFLLKAVKEAFEGKRFRSDIHDPELVAQVMWSGVHGIVSLILTKGSDDWVEWRKSDDTVRLYVDSMLRGMTTEDAHG